MLKMKAAQDINIWNVFLVFCRCKQGQKKIGRPDFIAIYEYISSLENKLKFHDRPIKTTSCFTVVDYSWDNSLIERFRILCF